MSRNVDLSKPLNEDEALYLQHRPWLIRDAELQGIEIQWPSEGESDESDDTDEEAEDEVNYEDLKVAELKAEIELRNEDREDDDKIVPESDKKVDLIAALEADDESDEDDEE